MILTSTSNLLAVARVLVLLLIGLLSFYVVRAFRSPRGGASSAEQPRCSTLAPLLARRRQS